MRLNKGYLVGSNIWFFVQKNLDEKKKPKKTEEEKESSCHELA